MTYPACPACKKTDTYPDEDKFVCPHCGHEWNTLASADGDESDAESTEAEVIRDSNGVELAEGDSVALIKDLKVKGASGAIKVGTKVRGIRLRYGSGDGHNISCKVDGFGAMYLKSEFVKKT